ncbi:MAG: trigger factor [Vulcanimicrobiota bacterium]
MKVVVRENSPSEKELEVTVGTEQVEGAYSQAFKKVLKQFAMPGFRRGKVPPALAKKYITDDGLTREVLEALVPRAYQEALEKENIRPLSEPAWDFVQNERGKELIFKATFEVKPLVELSDFRAIEVTQERAEIGDSDVEQTLNSLRERHGQIVPVEEDRGIEEGDLALVDYTSRDGDTPLEGQADNYLMEMKKELFIDGFIENLYGMKPGEEKEFTVTFPEDYANDELAGKPVTFEFKIRELKQRKLPDFDDDFAKTVSAHETLDALRNDVRERLESNVKQRAKSQAAGQILAKLLEEVTPESVPQALVNFKRNQELRREFREIQQHGLEVEAWLAQRGISQEQWLGEMQARGLFEARIELVIDSVAKSENLAIDEAELDSIIESEAKNRRMKPKKLRAQLREDGSLELLKYDLLRAKVQEHLAEQGSVTYVLPGEEPKPATKKSESKKKSKKETAEEPAAEAKSEKKAKKEATKEAPDEENSEKKAAAKKTKTKKKTSSKAETKGEKEKPEAKTKAKPAAKAKKSSSKSKKKTSES